jgi:hypothetical protein
MVETGPEPATEPAPDGPGPDLAGDAPATDGGGDSPPEIDPEVHDFYTCGCRIGRRSDPDRTPWLTLLWAILPLAAHRRRRPR